MILGSKLPVVNLVFLSDSSVQKTSKVEVVEIVSEQPRLLELFAIKKCASRPKPLNKRMHGHARITKVQTASL